MNVWHVYCIMKISELSILYSYNVCPEYSLPCVASDYFHKSEWFEIFRKKNFRNEDMHV